MLAEYLNLKDQLEYTRWKHAGKNSEEEEALLDKMDTAWLQLSEEERREVNKINYTPSLPRPQENQKHERMVDIDVNRYPGPVRRKEHT